MSDSTWWVNWDKDELAKQVDALREQLAARDTVIDTIVNDYRLHLLRGALLAVRRRIHYIGHPAEPVWERGPDWRQEISIIEDALYRVPQKGVDDRCPGRGDPDCSRDGKRA